MNPVFGGSENNMGQPAAEALITGPDLETIQTEEIGFLSVAGDTKIQLTTAWPSYTGSKISLLSIIPRKGLVAAAGPDQVIIAETDSVRKAFENVKEDDSNVQPFQPQLVIPMTIPISLLCFTADENYLILTAQTGGGIRVYEVQSLLQGSISKLFDLSTNQESLRSMTPNPIPEKAELCAIVTDKGNLHMANLKGQRISDVLCSQVSCISWSPKGKQLCAGLADGTIRQMTPEAEVKGTIPKPPGLGDCHVSSLLWLENNLFLAIHTTNVSMAAYVYHIITRHTSTAFTFQKIADPIFPFNSDKISHHSILRLRDFPPDIDDLLIVTSTTSTEIGLLSRCKAPLSKEKPITGVFTTTELLDDIKRPTLPITDSMVESTPIGVSLDLSSKDKVYRPIPSDEEIEESPGPLPALWVLTHEGILCQWWVVYRDSIKKGTTFPGLAAAEGTTLRSSTQAAPIISSSFAAPGPSTFSSSATSAPSFGTPSQLGQNSSWAGPADRNIANAADTQPVFGQTGGMRRSPWASTGPATSTFGQSGFASIANSGQGMGFSAAGAPAAPTTGGFAGYTAQSGFGSLAANKTGQNTFGNANKMSVSPFGGIGSSEASVDTAFPPKESMSSGGIFSSTPFKLQSSFKPDPQQSKENDEHPTGSSSSTNFGGTFESALETAINEPRASTPSAKDEDMDTEEPVEQTPQATQPPLFSPERQESTTPTTTSAASRFGLAQTPGRKDLGNANATAKVSSFSDLDSEANDGPNYTVMPEAPGVKSEEKDEPFPPETTSKNTNLPGESSSSSATSCVLQKPLDTPMKTSESETATLRSAASTPKASKPIRGIRESPVAQASEKSTAKTEEANDPPLPPLHPDFIKSSEAAASSVPLPPDPVQARPTSRAGNGSQPSELILPRIPLSEAYDISGGPEDTDGGIESGDDNASEGSGIDVAEDLSPSTNGLAPTPGFTPRSSFGGPRGSTATTVGVEHDRSKPLFGEVSRNAPMFPRPHATSSRSPSPIRGAVPRRALKWDATRSVSAPGISTQTLGTKKSQSVMGGSYGGGDRLPAAELSFIQQHRKIKARQEKEETQLLFDEEDDEVQKLLASYVVATLELDEFMAHSNSAPPAQDSIPSQVEAVYRDINSMIDTLGLNARSIKAFLKGHMEKRKNGGRRKEDLEIADDWVLCEVPDLGQILDNELYYDLKDGCVQDLDAKLGACHELARDMQRLRAKREDIKRVLMARLDSEQVEAARNLPLSAEQAAQQNKLRREYAKFSTLLAQVEEALTLLKTRMASASGSSGRGGTTAPTVDAVLRTITKITSMAEKRSGDIDVLETHMQKMRLGSLSREASPMVTPQQARGSIMSPSEWTPSRSFRSSYFGSASLTPVAKATPPKKRLSGFNSEEKLALMEQRARRQAVLEKIRNQVEKQGVHVRNLEDID